MKMYVLNRITNRMSLAKIFILIFLTGVEKFHGNNIVMFLNGVEKFVRNLKISTGVEKHVGNFCYDVILMCFIVTRVGHAKCTL